jgi:hypothetical protein
MANAKIPQPDLQAVTRTVKARCAHVVGGLEDVAQQADPIFSDPKSVMLELVLAEYEIYIAIGDMRTAWWPPLP